VIAATCAADRPVYFASDVPTSGGAVGIRGIGTLANTVQFV